METCRLCLLERIEFDLDSSSMELENLFLLRIICLNWKWPGCGHFHATKTTIGNFRGELLPHPLMLLPPFIFK